MFVSEIQFIAKTALEVQVAHEFFHSHSEYSTPFDEYFASDTYDDSVLDFIPRRPFATEVGDVIFPFRVVSKKVVNKETHEKNVEWFRSRIIEFVSFFIEEEIKEENSVPEFMAKTMYELVQRAVVQVLE